MDRIRIASTWTVLTVLSVTSAAISGLKAESLSESDFDAISAVEVRLSDGEPAGPEGGEDQAAVPQEASDEAYSAAETCWTTSRWKIGVDYSCWWLQGNPMPALVTSSPANTPRNQAGVLGQQDTRMLLGDQRIDDNARQGARLTAGYWFDDGQTTGLELQFFGLGGDDTHYAATSLGSPILARPFYDTQRGLEQALLVAFPAVVQGNVDAVTTSELYSIGAALRHNWKSGSLGRVDMIGGYRYVRFREGLRITDRLRSIDPGGRVPVDTIFNLVDEFVAETDFNGGEVGLRSEFYRGAFTLSAVTKLGIGGVHEVVKIDGSTLITTPQGQSVMKQGGLLTQPSNIGTFTRDEFGLLPELGVTLAYQVTPNLSVSGGYSLLYLTRVMRTGDQIDRAINTSQFAGNPGGPVGDLHPAPLLHATSLSAQGLNLGAEFRF